VGVHACTDITGFGLLGHACRVAQSSQVAISIHTASIPFFPEAEDFAKMGFCPAGLHRNREFYSKMVEFAPQVPAHMGDILFDPQTSGGLLISLNSEKAEELVSRLHKAGVAEAAIIGEIAAEPRGKVLIK
jgi:selenide,water dikinase